MIQLTRLNNQPMMVNSDLIKFVERAPDTVLTLVTGEKVIVLESVDVVLQKIVAFRQSILAGSPFQPSPVAESIAPGTPTPHKRADER
jgi:uncharacterized protein YlzI (FlbEa/FlbD family)